MSRQQNNQRRQPRQNQQQQQQQRAPFCVFCKNVGKNPFGHFVKDCAELRCIECKNCGKNGHTIKYCPYIERCQFCERVGHTEERCFYNPTNKIPKCQGCGKFGHAYENCFHVSTQNKNQYKENIRKIQEEHKKTEEETRDKLQEFMNKGFTYSESYLRTCKKGFEGSSSYIPWVIFCDEESDDESFGHELTQRELDLLENIKYQVSMLE